MGSCTLGQVKSLKIRSLGPVYRPLDLRKLDIGVEHHIETGSRDFSGNAMCPCMNTCRHYGTTIRVSYPDTMNRK